MGEIIFHENAYTLFLHKGSLRLARYVNDFIANSFLIELFKSFNLRKVRAREISNLP